MEKPLIAVSFPGFDKKLHSFVEGCGEKMVYRILFVYYFGSEDPVIVFRGIFFAAVDVYMKISLFIKVPIQVQLLGFQSLVDVAYR